MPTTQLNYDIVPDESPLYTTVDQLNQSTAGLPIIAKNNTSQPVTISEILIELMKGDPDTVQLLLPGSAGGIQVPNSLTGPGQSTWRVTSDGGRVTLTADGSGATFQPRDTLSLTLQNVVIREGGTGTTFVPIHEASDAGRGETEVGIAITQSTLNVQLRVPENERLIEPNGVATLTWNTNDATSGSLILPGNSPSSITLDSHTNLASGEQQVSPIVDTTYSLTCQGRGPNVTSQVTVSVDSLQMGELESSAEIVHVSGEVRLKWHTNADSCTLDDGSGNLVSVPSTVPNAQYPNGYPVNPKTTTTYTLHGTKHLTDGEYVDEPKIKTVNVYPVQLTTFSSSDSAFDASQTITLSWQTVDAVSCALSTKEGSGSVNLPVADGQTAACKVGATSDGQTLIVTAADGSNQELGRLTLPALCPNSATFILSAAGVSPKQMSSVVTLVRPQIDSFTGGVEGGEDGSWPFFGIGWSFSHAAAAEVDINGDVLDSSYTMQFYGTTTNNFSGLAKLTCHGFGGPIGQTINISSITGRG